MGHGVSAVLFSGQPGKLYISLTGDLYLGICNLKALPFPAAYGKHYKLLSTSKRLCSLPIKLVSHISKHTK